MCIRDRLLEAKPSAMPPFANIDNSPNEYNFRSIVIGIAQFKVFLCMPITILNTSLLSNGLPGFSSESSRLTVEDVLPLVTTYEKAYSFG